MPNNDKPVNGQENPSFFDLIDQTPPPVLKLDGTHGTRRLTRLRAAWKESWEEGGFLYQRWEEVFQARHAGWHEVATWIKAVALFGGLSLIVMMVDAAGDIASATLKGGLGSCWADVRRILEPLLPQAARAQKTVGLITSKIHVDELESARDYDVQ